MWLAERQRTEPIWSAYGDPALIADRLHRQLAHRPRLALQSEHLGEVADVLAQVRGQVASDGPVVLAEVTEATRLACRP